MADALPPPPFVLRRATVPLCLLGDVGETLTPQADAEGCVRVDIAVAADGSISSVRAAADDAASGAAGGGVPELDLRGRLVLPTFSDMHTHIGALARGSRAQRRA